MRRCSLALRTLLVVASVVAEPSLVGSPLFSPSTDPNGRQDTFAMLSEKELKTRWSDMPGGFNVKHKLDQLQHFESVTYVDVKLVGFDGDGNRGIKLSASDFEHYIDIAKKQAAVHMLRTPRDGKGRPRSGAERAGPGPSHRVNVKTRYVMQVARVDASLLPAIEKAVREEVVDRENPAVPIAAVDALVRKEYKSSTIQPYTVYILNPKPPMGKYEGSDMELEYHYMPPSVRPGATKDENDKAASAAATDAATAATDAGEDKAAAAKAADAAAKASAAADADRGMHTCPTTVWAGKQDDRYIWIDITAGPISYGPQTAGDGIVTELSLPRTDYHLKLATDREHPRDQRLGVAELSADLASFVMTSCKLMVSPSLDRAPIKFKRVIDINILVIHDRMPLANGTYKSQVSPRLRTTHKLLEEKLKAFALPEQTVNIKMEDVRFDECDMCVAAYAHSLKTHTSNVMAQGLRTQIHQYLDAEEMYRWLSHFDSEYWGLTSSESTVIPVFLYDLSTTGVLLLDRFEQARAFDDMIIAVQTQSPPVIVDYACLGPEGLVKPVSADLQDASRPIMAAVLQSVYGVAPTHETWSPQLKDIETNMLFSTGDTPFGPMSHSLDLSFSQSDAAMRNVIYGEANHSMWALRNILLQFQAYGTDLDEVLPVHSHQLFVQRWNVFMFKLEKASMFLSMHNFKHALYFARSMEHDYRAMHTLVELAGRLVSSHLHCEAPPKPVPTIKKASFWSWRLAALILLVTAVYGCHAMVSASGSRSQKKSM